MRKDRVFLDIYKLRELTFRKGLTQRMMSKDSGVSIVTINGIYNGRATTKETAIKIATVLDVPLKSIEARG